MKNQIERIIKKEAVRAIGVVILIAVGLDAISWLLSCGMIFLICKCFGWTFSWWNATGIWLIVCIVKKLFGKGDKK